MNYKRHYDLLVNRSKSRQLSDSTIFESHHIIPLSEGGDNTKGNKVYLTPREHFVAHWLLYRDNPTIKSRALAFNIMCRVKKQGKYTPSSRVIEEARVAAREAAKGSTRPESVKEKIRQTLKEYNQTEPEEKKLERKKKASEKLKGKKPWIAGKGHSEETKQRMKQSHTGRKHSEETKQKIGAAHKGKTVSEETKEKLRLIQLEKKKN